MPDGLSRRKLLALLGLSTTTGCLRFAGDETANETSGAGARGGSPRGTRAKTRTLRPTATPTPRQGTATSGKATRTAKGTRTATPTETSADTPTNTPTDTPTETATPTDEPSGTKTATPSENPDYPSGVSKNDVTQSLVLEHRLALDGKSYTVEYTRSYGYEPITSLTKVKSDGTAYRTRGLGAPLEVYANSEGMFQRQEHPETGDVLFNFADRQLRTEEILKLPMLTRFIEAGKYVPDGWTTQNGTNVLDLVAEKLETAAPLTEWFALDAVTSFTGDGSVSEQGRIQKLKADFSYERGDETGSQSHIIRTRDVGSTTFAKPDWVSEVKSKEPKFDVGFVDNGKFVELIHTGGQAVPMRTFVSIGLEQERFTELRNGIEKGQTVYFYKGDSAEKLAYSVGSKPDADPDPWTSEVWMRLEVLSLNLISKRLTP